MLWRPNPLASEGTHGWQRSLARWPSRHRVLLTWGLWANPGNHPGGLRPLGEFGAAGLGHRGVTTTKVRLRRRGFALWKFYRSVLSLRCAGRPLTQRRLTL